MAKLITLDGVQFTGEPFGYIQEVTGELGEF